MVRKDTRSGSRSDADKVTERILQFNKGRDPFFLAMKYAAMRKDYYRFFRATAHLFYEDIPKSSFLFKAPLAWLCGDLHLENFGSYKGDNGVAYFNINDFDECALGSPLLDLARMMTSLYIASESLGISQKEAHKLNDCFVNTYFEKLEEGYIRVLEKETSTGVIKKFLKEVKARKRKSFIKKRTVEENGSIRLLIDQVHTSSLNPVDKARIKKVMDQWALQHGKLEDFKVKDVVHRIAGTSSLGLRRYVALVERKGEGFGFLLDIKETRPSCLNKHNPARQPRFPSEAERIVEVEKRFISDPPALLNSVDIDRRNFVMKELQPVADRIDYSLFLGDLGKLKDIVESMACIYAWSNLRAAGRQGAASADELMALAKKKTGLKKELKNYTYHYRVKMRKYYNQYCKDVDEGSMKIKTKYGTNI